MNCNNCTNSNALKEVKIKHVHGNVLRMAIPLTLRTIELVDGEINATDTPFVPSSEHPVKVVFSKGSVSVALDATMKDGNIAYIEEKGKIPVGTYAITVTCNDDNGNPYRFKQNAVLYVADATIDAGIEETIEYEVTTWYLDAAIFLALKGEDGVGIYDIETQSSGEIGGVNTVTFILTDGRTRSFNILNGSGAVDSDLDINSPSPVANSAVTAKFNELSGELADLFGDVDYDSSSKSIRFWDKGKTNVLASLDARPFIKDGMVSNAYISNNTLVITFNTDSGKEAIGVPLTTVFNPNNYYTKTQVDSRIASAVANINLSNYYTKAQTDAKLSQKVNLDATTGRVDASQATRVVLDYIVGIYDGEDEPSHDVNAGDVWYDNGQIHYAYNNDVIVVIVSLGAPQKGIIYCNAENNKTYRWTGSEFVQVGGGNSEGGYEPPVGGIPKSDLAQSVQDTLDDVSNKVDKVSGKGLSTEDYTTAEKQKLDGLSNYDDTEIQAEVDAKYEKPSTGIPKTDLASDVQASLGKADTALQSQVQSDWNENDTSDPAYIANKPTIPEAQVNSDWYASSGVAQILNKPTIPTVPTNVSAFTNDAGYLTQHQDISGKANSADLATVATSGDYEDLANKPDIPTVPTNVSAFTNDAGYLTSQSLTGYATEGYVSTTIAGLVDSAPQTLDTLNELAEALGDDPNFATTMATQLGNKVDKETGKGLSTNDYTTAEKTKLAGLENYDDSALQTAIDGKVDKESGKSLMSDAEHTKLAGIDPSTYATKTEVNAKQDTINDLDAIRSGAALGATALQSFTEEDPTVPSWAKQQTKPTYTAQEVGALPASTTIPSKTSDLTNDSGFTSNAGTITGITMNNVSKGTSGVVDLGTVITAHQDISGKANASDVYTKTQTDTLLAGKQNTLTFDSTPTASSTNPVTSGGIKTYVDGKATITGITTSQDGTFTIALSDGNSYTVNLNHVHSQYVESDDLAEVATSGSYNDLSDKPTLFSGNYNDLSNKPTIPAAQVNADWNATSGVSRILNKPTIPTVPTNVSSFTNDAGYLTQHQSLANYYTKSEIDSKIGNIETLLASI